MGLTYDKLRYFRRNPTQACKHLLEIELCWFQRILLKAAWNTPFPMWICSRGLGKTFIGAIWLILKCLLYGGVQAWVFAKDYPFTLATFEKITEIYNNSPLLQKETVKSPNVSKNEASLLFKNGSYIKACPVRVGIRAHIILVDEGRKMDFNVLSREILPMCNVSHPELPDNQILIVSSADYDFNPLAEKFREYKKYIEDGNPKYSLCVFDVNDALTGPYMNQTILEEAKVQLLDEEYRMEYMSEFVSLLDGWIPGYRIRACERPYKPELKGDSGFEYVIAGDIARVAGGDNSAFVVFKVIPNEGVRVVRVVALNGVKIDEQAMILRQLVRDYGNVKNIVIDYEKLGMSIADLLGKLSADPRDGEELPALLLEDDNSYDKGLRIIKSISFSNVNLIWKMSINTKMGVQSQEILFPKDEYKVILSDSILGKMTEEEVNVYKAFKEMSELKNEISIMVPKAGAGAYTILVPKRVSGRTGKIFDDRFTAFNIGASVALDYYKELMNDDDSGAACCSTVRAWNRYY